MWYLAHLCGESVAIILDNLTVWKPLWVWTRKRRKPSKATEGRLEVSMPPKTVCLPIVMNTQILFIHFSTVQLSASCWSEYNSHLRISSSGYIALWYTYMYSWCEYHGIRFSFWQPCFKWNYLLLTSREDNNLFARRNSILCQYNCQHTKRLPLLEVQQTCWWGLVVIH